MELINLLETGIPMFGNTYGVSLNWIGNLIRLLISGVGIVGVGIILFSLILKLIVLPFDIYQRIGMRKQNIKMKENQEKMAKLQKQYANNKELYNQKVMEMYKESGISMFSSCLPMILSMVIFIVAINAFNAYSQYSNVQNYNTMVQAYNAELKTYCAELKEENISVLEAESKVLVKDADGANTYIYYKVIKGEGYGATAAENIKYIENAAKEYYIDVEKVKTNAEIMTSVNASMSANTELTEEEAIYDYFVGKGQDAVLASYKTTVKKNTQFLWIKNIWATDASYKHPVLNYSDFKAEAKQEKFNVGGSKVKYSNIGTYTNAYEENSYNLVTAKLDKQKSEANGYYILILLSIGTILLQQFVMMRSQKEQQKFSSVDGQGASQQKMMLVIMTAMFAIFSFMYSSAFSIYMITSNIFSLISTLVINKAVDIVAAKKEAKQTLTKFDNRRSERLEAAKRAGQSSAKSSQDKKAAKSQNKGNKTEE